MEFADTLPRYPELPFLMRQRLARFGLAFAVVGFILLCLIGLAATALVWVAGAHQYGVFSTVWQVTGIEPLIGTGLVAHVGSAVVLSGLHRRASWSYRGLVTFGVLCACPFTLLMAVGFARFLLGGD